MSGDKRFEVITFKQAEIRGLAPVLSSYDRDELEELLIDTENDNEIIYVDSSDNPEDKYLFRDLKVFVNKLNHLADELNALKGK